MRAPPGRPTDRRFRQVSTAFDGGPCIAPQRSRKSFRRPPRLACQTRLRGDVVVDVPAGSQIHKQVIVKELNAG
ncbi:MAG: hypothetical protein VX394_11215, partial [Pseudomonadota bacterium]|nr:hypothetical protein [Pseudomonadota bacterium]